MLAFIDVSGDPYGSPLKEPWIATSILCIRKRAIFDITATLFGLKRDILADEYIEMKSTDLVNKSTLNHPFLSKAKFLQEVVVRCIDHADCKHAALIFRNSGENKKSQETNLPKHYIDSLWRVEAIAREWNTKDVLVVIDNNTRKTDKHLAFAFNNYIYRSNAGTHLSRILPVPLFADSETTAGLQLADITAGIMRNFFLHSLNLNETPSASLYHEKLREYHEIIKRRSVNKRIEQFSVNGIFNPPNNYSV